VEQSLHYIKNTFIPSKTLTFNENNHKTKNKIFFLLIVLISLFEFLPHQTLIRHPTTLTNATLAPDKGAFVDMIRVPMKNNNKHVLRDRRRHHLKALLATVYTDRYDKVPCNLATLQALLWRVKKEVRAALAVLHLGIDLLGNRRMGRRPALHQSLRVP
jgi:hypothetical protein